VVEGFLIGLNNLPKQVSNWNIIRIFKELGGNFSTALKGGKIWNPYFGTFSSGKLMASKIRVIK